METKYLFILIIVAAIFMYVGSTMFYNTGLGVTDLKLEENTDTNQFELSYMLRSVRSFDYLDIEYSVVSEDGQEIGHGSSVMENITDGSFSMDKTIDKTGDASSVAKGVDIKVYTEEYNPGNAAQSPFFEQKIAL